MIQYPDDLESKFKFVTLASLRCEQLQKGAKPRLDGKSRKDTVMAQEEVLAGEVRQMTEDEIAEEQSASLAEPSPAEEIAEA